MTMPTSGTPATGSPFGTGEARDAGLFCFVSEIVDVLAVFPQGHALIMMASPALSPDAVWVADEEAPYLLLNTEVDHLSRRLMTKVSHAPLTSPTHPVLRTLQLFPTARVFLASALLFRQLPQLLTALTFERADTAPGHYQSSTRTGGHSCQVDFPQVDRCLHQPRSLFRLRDFDADVQFKSPVPHQGAGSGFCWQGQRQDEGGTPSTHRQDHPALFLANGLGRPADGIEAFGAPGVFHLHSRMLFAQDAGGLDTGEEGAEDCLHRLAMQGKPSFGEAVQFILIGPSCVAHPGLLVGFHAQIPHGCRFHLRRREPLNHLWGGFHPVYAHYFHAIVIELRSLYFLVACHIRSYLLSLILLKPILSEGGKSGNGNR